MKIIRTLAFLLLAGVTLAAAAGNDVDDACREASAFEELGDEEGGCRGVGRRLHDHGVARGHRRHHRAHGQHQGHASLLCRLQARHSCLERFVIIHGGTCPCPYTARIGQGCSQQLMLIQHARIFFFFKKVPKCPLDSNSIAFWSIKNFKAFCIVPLANPIFTLNS